MPKITNAEIDKVAERVYRELISVLGLKAARKAQLQIGRLLLQEQKRRKDLD